jgi:hypothetical protein
MASPLFMALFQKRIDGDDALLELASRRFKEACLGTEVYAGTPDELSQLLRFKPTPESPVVVHMDRRVDLFKEQGRNLIADFAGRFAGKVFGLVIHDQPEIAASIDDYSAALREIGNRFKKGPYLFIEYATGLEPDLFLEIFERIRDVERISACVDIGHIGLKITRDAYSLKHPGENVCRLTPNDPGLTDVIEDMEDSISSALPAVLKVIRELGTLKKHVHFHLHDAHPLSTFSPFGVSDHLSFLEEISIPFEYRGRSSLPLMYGPSGLSEIVNASLIALSPERISFSLEIHPTEGRAALGDASFLFNHWEDRTNAEKMNFWLSVLRQNHRLLLDACRNSL